MLETVEFLGFQVAKADAANLISEIQEYIYKGRGVAVQFSAAHGFVEAHKTSQLKTAFGESIVVSDGKPLSVYLKLKFHEFGQLRGTSFMRWVLSDPNLNFTHYFLGSSEDTLERLMANLIKVNPNLQIAGTISPPFTPDWESIVRHCIEDIGMKKPDFIWVGLGAPKQFLVADRLSKIYPGVFLSVGAAFDFLAGVSKEAPSWITASGFEWLFRLVSEPRRLFRRYIYGNLYFLYMLAVDFVKNKLYRRFKQTSN